MTPYEQEVYDALGECIRTANECYSAFNKLSCITRVTFSFYATDLYEARKICEAWEKRLEGKI